MKIKLAEKIPELLRLSPVRKRGKASPREKAWRSCLRGLSAVERKKLILARQQFAKGRKALLRQLNGAVGKTMAKFSDFKGVLIHGGFVEGKTEYHDIDLYPVVTHYEPTHDNLHRIWDMEGEIHKYMPPVSGKGRKESRASESFAHFSNGLVILDDPKNLREWTGSEKTRLWNFVGDAKTRKKLLKLMGEA